MSWQGQTQQANTNMYNCDPCAPSTHPILWWVEDHQRRRRRRRARHTINFQPTDICNYGSQPSNNSLPRRTFQDACLPACPFPHTHLRHSLQQRWFVCSCGFALLCLLPKPIKELSCLLGPWLGVGVGGGVGCSA